MAVRKVRRLKFGGKLFLIFLSIIILVISIGCYFLSNFSIFRERKKTVEKVEKTEKYPQKYSFDLFMVGDALIHSAVYEDALLSNGNYDFKPMLEYIKPISSGYDLSYYNQETILGGANLGYSNYPRFNSPDAVGDAFVTPEAEPVYKVFIGAYTSIEQAKVAKDIILETGTGLNPIVKCLGTNNYTLQVGIFKNKNSAESLLYTIQQNHLPGRIVQEY